MGLLRTPRVAPPEFNCGVDRDNAIFRDSAFVWTPANNIKDVCRNRAASRHSYFKRPRRGMHAAAFDGSATQGVSFDGNSAVLGSGGSTSGFTLIVVLDLTTLPPGAGTIMAFRGHSGVGGVSHSIYTGINAGVNFGAGGYNSAGTFTLLASNVSIFTETLYTMIATYSPSGVVQSFSINGNTATTNQSGFTFSEPQVAGVTLGCRQVSIGTFNSVQPFNLFFAAAIPRILTPYEQAEVLRNPYQAYMAEPMRRFSAPSLTIYRPGSDIIVNSWVPTPGGSLFDKINESALDRAGFISSPDMSTPYTFGWGASQPAGSWDYVVDFDNTAGSGSLRLVLLDDTNTQVGVSNWQAASATPQSYTFTVTTSAPSTRARIEIQP